MILKRTGDNEPACPACGSENAMLRADGDRAYRCRDCGYYVQGSTEIHRPDFSTPWPKEY